MNGKNMASWYDLVISCPACIAQNRGRPAPSHWYHADCGGMLKVSDEARLKCSKFFCGRDAHFSNWRWGCPQHGDSTQSGYYQNTNSTSVAAEISVSASMVSKAGKKWLMKFLDELGEW